MNVDRAAFLAFAAMIASATAACAAPADAASDESDIRAAPQNEGGGAVCFSDGEAAYPYKEGTCHEIYRKAGEDDYKNWTSIAEGISLAEQDGCQPVSQSHPATEGGGKICPSYAAEFAYGRCRAFVTAYKKSSAADAINCLNSVKDYQDSMAIYECGYKALDKACAFHPTAESTCNDLEAALETRGKKLNDAERRECAIKVSGVRAAGRKQLVDQATNGNWYGMHSALEGLDETF